MYFFRLNIKNFFLLKLSYLIISPIIPSEIVYGYELCEIKEDCFFNENFDKKTSLKKDLIDSKNSNNFFNKFINAKYALNWNRRSYDFQVYFEQDTKNPGLNFTIFRPSFKGLGK